MRRQVIAALTALVLVLMGLTTLTVASATPPGDDAHTVTICHATSSTSNPYGPKAITVDIASILVEGHGSHTGPLFPAAGWGDIIPSFDFGPDATYEGMNWPSGKAILDNNCQPVDLPNDPEPTPSPTPTTPPSEEPPGPAGSLSLAPTCVVDGGEADVVLMIDVDETFDGEYAVVTFVDGVDVDYQQPAVDGTFETTAPDGVLVESYLGALPAGLEDNEENWIDVSFESLTVDCPRADEPTPTPTQTPTATPTPTPTPTPTTKAAAPTTRVDVSSPASVPQTGF